MHLFYFFSFIVRLLENLLLLMGVISIARVVKKWPRMGSWGYPRLSTFPLCSTQFTRLDFKKVAEKYQRNIFDIFPRPESDIQGQKPKKRLFAIAENIYFSRDPALPFFFTTRTMQLFYS